MSDRKNRDIGQKRTKPHKWECFCWICTPGKDKLRALRQRADAKVKNQRRLYDE